MKEMIVRKHIKIKKYKRINIELEQKINVRSDRLDKAMTDFDEKMKTTKQDELFDYVEAPDYFKVIVKDYEEYDDKYDKVDYDITSNDCSKCYYQVIEN